MMFNNNSYLENDAMCCITILLHLKHSLYPQSKQSVDNSLLIYWVTYF